MTQHIPDTTNPDDRPPAPADPPSLIRNLWRAGLAFFRAGAGAYGLSVLLALFLRLVSTDDWWVTGLFYSFAHLLWLGALLLLGLAVVLRQWLVALLLAPGALAFLLAYGPMFLPRASALASGPEISLLTYNLYARTSNFEPALAIIDAIDADVVALQEVSQMAEPILTAALAERYPYIALHGQRIGTTGQGVLSKYPIQEDAYWRYDWLPASLGHQRVVVDFEGTAIALYNVHPSHPGMSGSFFNSTFRSREIMDLLGRAEGEAGPVLLMGDFNMSDLSDDYRRVSAGFADAYREAGWGMGWTFPRGNVFGNYSLRVELFPVIRLDYIFHSAHFRAHSAAVWPDSGASDHHPVYARLVLAGPGQD